MEKKKYEAIKSIKTKIAKGEKTTFSERNYLKINEKNKKK